MSQPRAGMELPGRRRRRDRRELELAKASIPARGRRKSPDAATAGHVPTVAALERLARREKGRRMGRIQQGDTIEGGPFDGFYVAYVYTREQAIEDGTLVDISEAAQAVGFTAPVACTARVWAEAVAWDQEAHGNHQDETGRLHDLVVAAWTGARIKARRVPDATWCMLGLQIVQPGAPRPTPHTYQMQCGPGDDGEPVFTIMRRDED